jgi:hypothetical protein
VGTVVGHLPRALAHGTGFVLGGTMYVAGGRTVATGEQAGSSSTYSGDVLAIDATRGTATVVAQLPGARSDLASAVVGSSAYLLGGETPSGATAGVVRITTA